MNKYIFKATVLLSLFFIISCENANDLLNEHIKNGPIVYAAKINEMSTQSGYYRLRANIYPGEDVNQSYCILRWNITEGVKDSVKVVYSPENFDEDLKCYYTQIDFPPADNDNIEGSIEITAYSVDVFGNKSLNEIVSAYIYGVNYVSSMVNAQVRISSKLDEIFFESRIGAVGNFLSYEQNDGSFTEEVFVSEDSYPLIDAKSGGIVRTKTRYLVNESDIDTLDVVEYLETLIPIPPEAVETMIEFRKTSPFLLDDRRLAFLNKFQTYSDNFTKTTFSDYLNSPSEQKSINMENTIPMLYFYREAFDKVLNEVKNTKVEYGSTLVWLLYNMGFVIKTPSGCFGIDIDHRLAEQFEPYLDFLLITHNHADHYNNKLIEAMNRNNKPILSNYYKKSTGYVSTTATNYQIGNFTIHTDISDHLADPNLPDFVTVFRIECGEDAGNFSMLHGGDSGFNPNHFKNVQGPVSMVVLRWGASRENNILGTGEGQVETNYAILSHLIELRHDPYPNGQASITKTLEHLPTVKCENTILPFWGEKLTWKNAKLY